MQPREKKLAMIVGGLCAVLVAYVLFNNISTAYSTRTTEHARLTGLVTAQNVKVVFGEQATTKMRELRQRSLPSDAEKTRSQYQSWLLGRLEAAGMENIEVKNITGTAAKHLWQTVPFSVTAKGTLPQLVAWLHDFYGTGHLHLIRKLTVTPSDKSKQLDIDLGVEVIALPGAAGVKQAPPRTDRLHSAS